jgi:hypothetical protein
MLFMSRTTITFDKWKEENVEITEKKKLHEKKAEPNTIFKYFISSKHFGSRTKSFIFD